MSEARGSAYHLPDEKGTARSGLGAHACVSAGWISKMIRRPGLLIVVAFAVRGRFCSRTGLEAKIMSAIFRYLCSFNPQTKAMSLSSSFMTTYALISSLAASYHPHHIMHPPSFELPTSLTPSLIFFFSMLPPTLPTIRFDQDSTIHSYQTFLLSVARKMETESVEASGV